MFGKFRPHSSRRSALLQTSTLAGGFASTTELARYRRQTRREIPILCGRARVMSNDLSPFHCPFRYRITVILTTAVDIYTGYTGTSIFKVISRARDVRD
jgi:hypothetical protein